MENFLAIANIFLLIISTLIGGYVWVAKYSKLTYKEMAILPYKDKNMARAINTVVFLICSLLLFFSSFYFISIHQIKYGIVSFIATVTFIIFFLITMSDTTAIFIHKKIRYEIIIIYENETMLVKRLDDKYKNEEYEILPIKTLTEDSKIIISDKSIISKFISKFQKGKSKSIK